MAQVVLRDKKTGKSIRNQVGVPERGAASRALRAQKIAARTPEKVNRALSAQSRRNLQHSLNKDLAHGKITEQEYNERLGLGVPEIDTAQPSPESVDATPFTSPSPIEPMSGAPAPTDSLGTSPLATRVRNAIGRPQQPTSRYQQGFQMAQAQGTPPPQTPATGRSMVGSYLPEDSSQSEAAVNSMFQADVDPFWQEFGVEAKDFFSPVKQRESLMSEYNRMYRNSGLESLNEEMINMKNVIDGTNDDIRDEIQKAGGFGTESQVEALTNARNKTLIKNYNKLVDLQTSKQNHLDTMLQLSQQDRQLASQEANQRFNMGMQMMQYRDSFLAKAEEKAKSVINSFGGIKNFYEAYKDDPYAIKKAETALGLGAGGLAKAASAPMGERETLELQKLRNEVYGTGDVKTQFVELPGGGKALINATTGDIIKDYSAGTSVAQGQISSLREKASLIDSLATDKNLNAAVGPSAIARFNPVSGLTGGRSNFIAGVQQLVSGETLGRLLDLKKAGGTLGALSEGERETLQNSATKINAWAIKDSNGNIKGYKTSEKSFRDEINRLNRLTKKALIEAGESPESVGARSQSDGSIWMRNSDGTYTKIK